MMNKEQILKHIQAARLWLDKAQDFVENNNIIRGLSFLFLASAETQMPLRESQKVEKKERPQKSVFRFRPVYGAALAASIAFIVSFTGWKLVMQSNQQVTAQRVSASEFVARMKEANERESTKASSMLDETLNALQRQLEESMPDKKSPRRMLAFRPSKKIRKVQKHFTTPPVDKEIKKTEMEKPSYTVITEKNISPAAAEDDLIGLVKIAEKTLRGQN